MTNSKRALCILGMHRSGTSCLTGLLEQSGVFLGEISRQNPYNLKGNCENQRIMALHDALFQVNGGTWDNPPKHYVWTKPLEDERDNIVASYGEISVWGFKDPRTLYFLNGWIKKLPGLEFVGIFRHPLLVAASLRRRNRFSIEQGVALWQCYNQRLLEWHLKLGFPLIAFNETFFPDAYQRLMQHLNLSDDVTQLDFFSPELRSLSISHTDVMPLDATQLYRTLEERSL